MAEVKRAHRRLAIAALGYHPTNSAPQWIETGFSFTEAYGEAERIADAIADAEARGYAACKADVVALLHRVAEMSVKQVARVLYMLVGRIDRDDFVPSAPDLETACQEATRDER